MRIQGIQRELLLTLLALGASQHPREFVAILREEDGIIGKFSLAPGTVSTGVSAGFPQIMMPLDTHTAGSAHSHPNGALSPSDADLRFFPTVGRYHFIIGAPYNEDCWRCFSADGKAIEMEVIG